jgi:hypothetical protein
MKLSREGEGGMRRKRRFNYFSSQGELQKSITKLITTLRHTGEVTGGSFPTILTKY